MNKKIKLQRYICMSLLVLLLLLSGCAENKPATEAPSEQTDHTEGGITTRLVLATLNIKHGEEGLEKISDAIRQISPDIIGLEEVDVGCERSGYVDEPAELARLAGYPYHAFARAMSIDGGEYGTALLSRYPIESFEVIPLFSGYGEDRSVGHAVISVDGVQLHAFVTHLSYNSRMLLSDQMKSIAALLHKCDRYALLADLNSFHLEDIHYLEGAYYVNRPDRSYITYHRWNVAIDNIVVSEGFTEITSGISDTDCSDHNLLYATFQFSGKFDHNGHPSLVGPSSPDS